MRAQVESILTRLHMDFSNMTRDASCNFVLLLSQMGCPSCSTGVSNQLLITFRTFYVSSVHAYRKSALRVFNDHFACVIFGFFYFKLVLIILFASSSFILQAGLEACSERLKNLENELGRARSESSSLSNRVESALEIKNQVEDKLSDRENVIQSLTETIDQLVSLVSLKSGQFTIIFIPLHNLSCLIDSLYHSKAIAIN